MVQENLTKYRRSIALSYVFMFLALFSIIPGIFAYYLARNVSQATDTEVWLNAQALWVMRNTFIFLVLAIFASLWFIPLNFYYWDSYLWVTACTMVGVIFSFIAFLYFLSAWLKGMGKFFKNQAVF